MVRMMSRGPDAEEPTEEERRAYEKQEATVQETQ